jgi:hypothetical protein
MGGEVADLLTDGNYAELLVPASAPPIDQRQSF